MDIYQFLADHDIGYEHCDHPAVYTCEEAARLVPLIPGTKTKNLFLRDRKGLRHFLVTVAPDKTVDLKALTPLLGVTKLSLASAERLQRHLGLEPGAVTLLGVVNDSNNAVEVVIDKSLWTADAFQCHPLVNTSTLSIQKSGIERLFAITGHRVHVIEIPQLAPA